MTSSEVEAAIETLPVEIRDAIESLNGQEEQAILVVLLEEGELSFTELQTHLDLSADTLDGALTSLRRGGLITQKSDGTFQKENALYSASEYGERVMAKLLETLGTAVATD